MKSWTDFVRGQGPDHFAAVEVRPADAARVRDAVRALSLPGFRRTEIAGKPLTSEFRGPAAADAFDVYVDVHHHDAIVAQLRGETRTNIWIYTVVSVGAGQVWIEHGYGNPPDECISSEAEILRTLSGMDLGAWSFEWGG